MCGIAGILKHDGPTTPEDMTAVQRMMDAQDHRGPDGSGTYQDNRIVLGHRRLAIIDLSEAGRQPMANEDGTVWVTYNGEIYNFRELRRELIKRGHRFRSETDTEVLLHGYEEWAIEGLLSRLRGMFAFALYDTQPSRLNGPNDSIGVRLFLAKDRFGIKPLYYAYLPDLNQMLFASEVRTLLQSGLVPREENPQAWLAFLLFGSVPLPWTTVKSIQALPPGHYLVADGSGPRLVRYYSIDSLFTQSFQPNKPNELDEPYRLCKPNQLNELEAEIRAKLEETVALHLISDAPLGVFLSGGIDSSALVALAALRKQDLVTLGVVFDEKSFSEEGYQQEVAKRFGTQHHTVPVTLKDFQNELEQFLKSMDQPTVDGLNTYFVARAARQAGLKTVLSGIGGDEIFCGYPTLRRAPTLGRLCALPAPLKTAAIFIGSLRQSYRKLAFLAQNGHLGFYLVQRGLFTPREAAQLLGTQEREAWALIKSLEPQEAPRNPVLLQQFLEARHYLVDQLLKDADVFGMAHSVEVRVPFLDHVLVETVLKAPLAWRLDSYWPKPLLTRPLRDLLPEEVVFRPKQGFTLPLEVWLRADKGIFQDGASGLNAKVSWNVREAFLSGRAHWSRPWVLSVLASFREMRWTTAPAFTKPT